VKFGKKKKILAVKNVVYLSFWANLDLPTKPYIFGVWLDWDVGKIKIIEKPEHPFSIVKGLPRFLFRPFLLAMLHVYIPNTKD